MSSRNLLHFIFIIFFGLISITVKSTVKPDSLYWHAGFTSNVGTGDFAPYYISSLTSGIITHAKGLIIDAGLRHNLDTTKRFSWGAGIQLLGSVNNNVSYLKWNSNGDVASHKMHPSNVGIQQLYAIIKYRSLFLEAGIRDHRSFLLDNSLTSGDWIESGNAKGIPQVRAGFLEFQNIPLTKGWIQIQGEIAYGKFMDNKWMKEFYSYANSHINLGAFYLYRRLFFRTNPSKNFYFTVGMQAAGEIGGETQWWYRGKLEKEKSMKVSFWRLLKSIIPTEHSSAPSTYYTGNNLGTWDVHFNYSIPGNQGEIHAYLQKPWEKGNSIAFRNGWDGLWGVQYDFPKAITWIEAVLVEYIYLMNQSGPIHFSPNDYPGTSIGTDAQGRDDYYNNVEYNSYINYGVGIGSPFLKAPIYNTDGYPQYIDNLVKGFHVAAKGNLAYGWRWKIAVSYREAYGNGSMNRTAALQDFSWLLQAEGKLRKVPSLNIKLQVAADHGSLLGNNFGILLGVIYQGNFSIKR